MTPKFTPWDKRIAKGLQKQHLIYLWLLGLLLGGAFYKIPAICVAVSAFSLIMFFTSMRSDALRFTRLFSKGMKHYKKGHFSYAYVIMKKAFEINPENHELVRTLVLVNIELKKDPVETRILIDTLESKWASLYTDTEIEDLRSKAFGLKKAI